MKLFSSFSAWVVFAALLCLAPYALGQSTFHNNVKGAGSHFLRHAPSSVFVFTFGPGIDNKGGGNGGGDDKGCGKGDQEWGRGGNGGRGCKQVPEGGSALMYVLLAVLCCLGGMFLRLLRQPACAQPISKI